jgi:quercetin dioxygenase-like cupin family protein
MKKLSIAFLSVLVAAFAHQSVSQQHLTEPKMTVIDFFGMEPRNPMEGITARGTDLATFRVARIELETGHSTPDHNHPDEEMIILLEGQVKAVSGDEEFIVNPGEMIIIPAYVQHHYEAIESSVSIEVFGPGVHNRSFGASE